MVINNKQVAFRLVLSVILSSFIGIDRESTKKPAGLRTHVLVSLGSTLVMILSVYLNQLFTTEDIIHFSDRLPAQVISGIGFLGAGTILRRDGGIVTGLTTAASLWVVATIGLAVGAGFYLAAIITTVLVVLTLMFFQKGSEKIKTKSFQIFSLSIVSTDKPGQVGQIGHILGDYNANILSIDYEQKEEELIKINLEIAIKEQSNKYELLNSIANIDGIFEVSQKK
jgi:putative Mg2+ transporter-C (MgtC) family protein